MVAPAPKAPITASAVTPTIPIALATVKLCSTAGFVVPIEVTGQYRVGDIRQCWADLTQAKRLLGFAPTVSLAQGLERFTSWARQQPETLADMAARFIPLSEALDGLNGALYSESGQHWQGRNLWLAIRSLPPTEDLESTTNPDTSALPPLYPR